MAASALERKADQLFDFAVSNPEGFTYEDVVAEYGWPRTRFYKIVRCVRMQLGEDEITLVCSPQGSGEPWLYRLGGTYEDAQVWAANRVQDAEARIGTMAAVMSAVVNATDGRSLSGRKARKMQRALSRLAEDLVEIENEMDGAVV